MARRARAQSSTDIYHVVFKGINHESLFGTEKEKKKIISIVKKKMIEHQVEIYAYCVMSTHMHLLMRGKLTEISKFISRCEIIYSIEYNVVKNRNGHVFQNRFYSDGIETEERFWNCINYIHNNPVKAFLVEEAGDYLYSSYREYIGRTQILVTSKARILLGKHLGTQDAFIEFTKENRQSSWFSGTDEEIAEQKKELIAWKVGKIPDLKACLSLKGNVSYCKTTKEIANELGVTQKEVIEMIKKKARL